MTSNADAPVESPQKLGRKWSSYMLDLYVSQTPPVLGTVSVFEIEEKAREKLKDHIDAFNYIFGSAGTCSTYNANCAAFDKYRLIPHMLRDTTELNVETTIFGVKYPSPLLLAPIGVIQGIVHSDAELATARAASKLGVPMIMSTASTRSIEEIAEANGQGHRWYQLYWPKTPEITISLLNRAKQNGFTALVVTLDTTVLGWRTHNLATTSPPFSHSTGGAIGMSDPVFMAQFGLKPRHDHAEFPFEELSRRITEGDEEVKTRLRLGRAWLREVNSGLSRTWENLAFLKEHWKGPVVLKGIQSVADAEMAVDFADGIVVSNHGGRQVDGAIASLDALDKIGLSEKVRAAQQSGKFTVLFDSGIRTGSDILKALALGAQGVLLGRPYIYGLCLAGEAGVDQQIRSILADLELTLGLCGYKNIEEIHGNREAYSKAS